MRNNLNELPVLLACLWTGAFAGSAVFVLRLPKALYMKRHRGLRTPWGLKLLFGLADIAACAGASAIFAAGLLHANGGELRLYAAAGFAAGLFFCFKLWKTLLL